MTRSFIPLALVAIIFSCSSPENNKKANVAKEATASDSTEIIDSTEEKRQKNPGVDRYRMVIRYIDNRAVVSINDSTIYDSQTVYGEVDVEIDLTSYVEANKTNLKVEVYNGKPPYNTASPAWEVVYDIFLNDQLVEFVREESRDGDVGLVYTEEHDLSDIW